MAAGPVAVGSTLERLDSIMRQGIHSKILIYPSCNARVTRNDFDD